ncbi:hypothetical protein HKX48_007992 [Thoreauomyces humboldtii]|nr:hypothetical protein HKX48_007992 [Thoreauomyces humboldtii]
MDVVLLIHVLGNLDYRNLQQAQLVCRRWYSVISDDSCWRHAFEINFGSLPLRRLGESSWRKEYLKRVQLLRGFQSGKHIVRFDPRIGKVDQFFLDYQDGWMYCGSLERGMVAFCHPSTGRVEKGYVYFTDDHVPAKVECMLLDRHRIAVGSATGTVALVSDFKDRANYVITRFTGFHLGPVTCLAWIPDLPGALLTGGLDGTVKLWDVKSKVCVRTLTGPTTSPIRTIACDKRLGVLAGNDIGDVNFWAVDVTNLLEESASLPSLNSTSLSTTRTLSNRDPSRPGPVSAIAYDAKTASAVVAVSSDSTSNILQWDVRRGTVLTEFAGGHAARISVTTWHQSSAAGKGNDDRLLLATGDVEGSICIWDVPKAPLIVPSADAKPTIVKPSRSLKAHRSPITKLLVDGFKVCSGATDGSVKLIDLLTGRCIRTLVVRRIRGGNDGLGAGGGAGGAGPVSDKATVRCIWAGHYQVVVATGDTVKSWDFSGISASAGKGKSRKGAGGARGWVSRHVATNPRTQRRLQQVQQRMQIRDDVRDDRWERDLERDAADESFRLAVKMNGHSLVDRGGGDAGGKKMTESELMSYAMMVSMENLHVPSVGGEDEPYDKDLMEAMEKSLLDEHSVVQPALSQGNRDSFSQHKVSPPQEANTWARRASTYGSSAGSSASSLARSGQWDSLLERYEVRPGRYGVGGSNSGNLTGAGGPSVAHGNVTVAQRLPSQAISYAAAGGGTGGGIEDEELQYVLELSKVEK